MAAIKGSTGTMRIVCRIYRECVGEIDVQAAVVIVNRATPPLIDSTMYFLSGAEVWRNVTPLVSVMSVKWTATAGPELGTSRGPMATCGKISASKTRQKLRKMWQSVANF